MRQLRETRQIYSNSHITLEERQGRLQTPTPHTPPF